MDAQTVKAINTYFDEIADLAAGLPKDKRAELRARVSLIRDALAPVLQEDRPVTDTGSLDQYLPEWDKPSEQVAAEKGISVQMVEAVKVALENGGLTLQYPSDPAYHGQGWHKIPAGQALPPDWEERLKNGQPLQ